MSRGRLALRAHPGTMAVLLLLVAFGAILVAGNLAARLLLVGPPASSSISITSDFDIKPGTPEAIALAAVQSDPGRFGMTSAAKEFVATLTEGRSDATSACVGLSVTIDESRATRYLLEVTPRGGLEVSASILTPSGWAQFQTSRASRCEALDATLPAST